MTFDYAKTWPQACAAAFSALWVLALATCHLEGSTIYVDNRLTTNCIGNYSITNRNGSGTNGTAYPSLVQAANVAVAGVGSLGS